MKKSVVILISLIYVASIALVGFLGLKPKTYNDVIYVESIELLCDYGYYQMSDGTKHIIFTPANSADKHLQFKCRVVPDDASNKKVLYSIPQTTNPVATIDQNGLLTFADGITGNKKVTVRIYSDQDRDIYDEIIVHYIPPAS